jgi:hypothetical protein
MADLRLRARATRELANLRSFIRRDGLTGHVRERSARFNYERALAAIVAVEDAEGVDAAAKLSDRLRRLRWEASDAGLLTPSEILTADRRVLGGACEWYALCENPATGTRSHTILGDVPICERCDAKVEALS